MRLIQCVYQGQVRAAQVESDSQVRLLDADTYSLARRAIAAGRSLADIVEAAATETRLDYSQLIDEKSLLPPLTHPDPAHCLVTGTGLTHLGSADTRSAMHAKTQVSESELTDSMRMFKLGVEGGKPQAGTPGAQPEWFYKGDGACVVAPEAEIPVPHFAEDAGEEPELAGLYVIGDDGHPWQVSRLVDGKREA